MIFPGGLIGGYAARAVTFDGTNDYLKSSATPTGVVDGKIGLLSFWIKLSTPASMVYVLSNGGIRFRITVLSSGLVTVVGLTTGVATAIGMQSTSSVATGAWKHILAAWDTSTAANCKLYVNGSDATDLYGRSDASIDYDFSSADWSFCSDWSGASKVAADVAEFWCDTAQWMDITSTANREKFVKNGRPMNLDSDGSKPTGTAPQIYFKGPAANWGTNAGTGGSFTVTGSLTDATTKPSY